jgi:UDP-N-acetyl-D-mannosaminuronate dehydrogenase
VNNRNTVLVVGLGEVGVPLRAILSQVYEVKGIDVASPAQKIEQAEVMHICYPFQIKDFCGETARYIERFKPALTVINSTVEVGTTRKIADWTGADVVHSPVRGKHARMQQEMLSYTKFIGAVNSSAAAKAMRHFESAGFKTKCLGSPEATELGKLAETTYFGVLIAWAQELQRYCDRAKVDYDEVVSLYDEINFFPQVKYIAGVIGGHCVMPNIEILCNIAPSGLLEAIRESNRKKKIERDDSKQQEQSEPELIPAKLNS